MCVKKDYSYKANLCATVTLSAIFFLMIRYYDPSLRKLLCKRVLQKLDKAVDKGKITKVSTKNKTCLSN